MERAIRAVDGKMIEEVTVSTDTARSLKIALKLRPCSGDEARRLGTRIMNMPELEPFTVDMKVTLAQ